jgi:NAD(P)-dependent dehydrogenase (short-subunit alcohol dehydrogenase family)
VQTAAQQFVAQESRLDLLMCNAGVMILPPSLSKDGYEIQFAINHLSHALFAKLLLPTMLKTAAETPNADVRIISLSSTAHSAAPSAGIEFENLSTDQSSCGPFFVPSKFARYGQSKLANLVYPMALAKHYPSITSVAVHPGFVRTALHDSEGMFDKILVNTARKGEWLKPEQGAHTQLWAATTAKKGLVNGAYYEPIGVKVVPGLESARDGVLAERLWEWTEKALARFA